MPDDKIFRDEVADKLIEQEDYANAAGLLLKSQKQSWGMAADGYSSIGMVKTKTFQLNGYTYKVQFNPGRITSSSARIDDKSIKERKCFLCVENLPKDQRAIQYGSDYLILVNPFPIFPEHFTITNVQHIPQQIKTSFGSFLSLSKDLGKNYTVFYNGPKCGASAPDHLHFQAGIKNFMPIENDYEILKMKYGEMLSYGNGYSVYAVSDGMRNFISFESREKNIIENLFNRFYDIYSEKINIDEEPMMNIISIYNEHQYWKVLIFLREKHRPSHYFAEGEANILLSPAAVDFGGVCITPLEKDYNKITQKNIEEIISEVAINSRSFASIKNLLKDIKA